jgi:uncharacterized protein YukE
MEESGILTGLLRSIQTMRGDKGRTHALACQLRRRIEILRSVLKAAASRSFHHTHAISRASLAAGG